MVGSAETMNLNISMKALLMLVSLPGIKMANHNHGVLQLQRRVAAFSSAVWNKSPARHRQHHVPRPASPLLANLHRQCLVQSQQPAFSRRQAMSYITNLFMASDDDNENNEELARTSFNIQALKKETTRLTLRAHKKVGKVSTRIRAAEAQYEKLRVAIDESTSEELDEKLMQQLEQAPNVEQYKVQMKELQDRLQKLNWLEEQFSKSPLKSKKVLPVEDLKTLSPEGEQVLQYVLELDINDDESQKQKRIEENARNRRSKKERAATLKDQNQQQGPRLPYRRYYTEKQVEIRVGKQATDNDVLSLSSEHRSGSHWWYHASGCAGSHVVLCTDAASPSQEDVLDAAALAALKSKCIGQSVIKVSMTRARNVSKPPGAKPGLVQLNGDVKTVTLRKGEVEKRCKRLEETVVVN
mmetsp:Transcript_21851/g.46147  ORF Transcript_21851/g.46147 Transcript_21851/m.46147 type:complete len:412 (+) Transcript_21851:83-1318(+)